MRGGLYLISAMAAHISLQKVVLTSINRFNWTIECSLHWYSYTLSIFFNYKKRFYRGIWLLKYNKYKCIFMKRMRWISAASLASVPSCAWCCGRHTLATLPMLFYFSLLCVNAIWSSWVLVHKKLLKIPEFFYSLFRVIFFLTFD